MSEAPRSYAAADMRIDQFQFVSLVETLDISAAAISCRSRIPDDHSIFGGHFPGHPIMPGVLLTELMAQTCGFLLLSLNGFAKMPFLASLKEVKLRDFVGPGTELVCESNRVHEGSGYAVLEAKVRRPVETKLVCSGTLMFRIVPFPNAELNQHMQARAQEVGLLIQQGNVILSGAKTI